MKPKTLIAVVLLGFAAASVGVLVVKEVRGKKPAPPRTANPIVAAAVPAGGASPAGANATAAVAPTPAAPTANAEGAPPAEADSKVVTVYWFYDNKR